MENYNILIYGGGNCELGGQMGACFEEIEHMGECQNVKVFGRAHVFNQTCLNMYGRFDEIKKYIDLGGSSGQGGIYEYFYDGSQTIKTCEMKIQPITKESFEDFLVMGKERLGKEELILVLMGQGTPKGMFMDFALEEPSVLGYEEIFKCIEEVLYPEVSQIHLVIDVANWHYIQLLQVLSRYQFFKSIYIYKRPEVQSFFPIGKFIQYVEHFGLYYALKQKELSGYWVNLSDAGAFEGMKLIWQKCKKQRSISHKLQEVYRQFVEEIHSEVIGQTAFQRLLEIEENNVFNEIQDYFSLQYDIIVDEKNLNEWLESLKICTDYHKL